MLLAGDEFGRTQRGNNNAYCQDNDVSWVDWEAAGKQTDLFEFTCSLIALRRDHPVFRRRRFFSGAALRDITWLTPAGAEMAVSDWRSDARALAVLLNGAAITEPGPRGETITDHSFLLLFNACDREVTFALPAGPSAAGWVVIVDTARPEAAATDPPPAPSTLAVGARTALVLQAAGQ